MNVLKTRLFFSLFVVVTAIGVSGGIGIWLLKDHLSSFHRIISRDFQAVQIVNDFRIMTADLESHYLTKISGNGPVAIVDEDKLKEIRKRFDVDIGSLAELAKAKSFSPAEREAVQKLSVSVEEYLKAFDEVFSGGVSNIPEENREQMRDKILDASYKMADEVKETSKFLENSFNDENQLAIDKTEKTVIALFLLSIFAVIMTAFAYLAFTRKIVNPLYDLTSSIREVQQQNFELILPVKSKDEIGQLASAYNDMAAELRVMKMATDQEMLRLSQERSAIIDGFPYPVLILDSQGNLSQSNPAAATLAKALKSKTGIPKKIESRVKKCIKSQEDYLPDDIGEAMLIRIQEREFWYLPRIFKIDSDSFDDFTGWAVVLMDVTRVRWLDEIKSDMIGTVSHEIKTPLTSIRMILHLLVEQKTGELNSMQETMVTSACDDCERLLETLENLLQLSRMEGGQQGLQMEPIEPSQLLDDAVAACSGISSDISLEIENSNVVELPHVLADHHRIGQVLSNFITNAVKHSPKNGKVVLSAKESGERFVRFSVQDTGAGVPESEQDKIFDRFYRSLGQETDGTGLGLWISREIVRAHDGRIGVESEEGSPTTFYFEIPQSSN